MTLLIVSIAMVAVTSVLSFGITHQSDGLWQARAVSIADSYLEQILARRYDENTPIGGVPACSPLTVPCSSAANFDDGEPRAQFDDVDDFNGLLDVGALDENGVALAGYERYTVAVEVAYPDAAQQAELGLARFDDAKIVTVTITPPAESSLAFRVVRANF